MEYWKGWNKGNNGTLEIRDIQHKKGTDKKYKYLKNHYGKWSDFMMKIKIT